MKIIHITNTYIDGWGYQENLLPKYQSDLGHEVIVITSDKGVKYSGDFNPNINKKNIYMDDNVKVIRKKSIKVRGSLELIKGINEVLEKEKPDYIYHHGIVLPSLLNVVRYKKNNPNVFLAIDNHTDYNIITKSKIALNGYYPFFKNYLKNNMHYIDLFFGVTPERTDFLSYYYGVPRDKVRLLPIGVDNKNKFRSKLSRNFIEKIKTVNKEDYDLVILTGGKLNKEKNTDKLINVVGKLNESKKVLLILFGKVHESDLQILIKNNINFILQFEWLNGSEIKYLMSISDIGVWLGQHTTLFEDCISCGLPLVIPFYGTTYHLIKGNGKYLYSTLTSEVEEFLVYLLSNKHILCDMKRKSQDQLIRLSYSKIAKESIEYIKQKDINSIHEFYMQEFYNNRENIPQKL